jgi:hypothetical protein
MEGLAALGLAASICQLIDFSSRLVRDGKQIFKSGTSIEVRHMSLITEDLKKLLSSMSRQLDISTGAGAALTPEEQVSVIM